MSATGATGQKALFAQCRALRGEGKAREALELLQDALRRNLLNAEGVLHAGRLLQKIYRECDSGDVLRVAILGQCTTSWLVPALTAVACGRGSKLLVTEADYDNVIQGIDTLDIKTDAVIFLPWSQRLLGAGDYSSEQRIDVELEFWRTAWSMARRKPDLHIVQVGYDWVDSAADGHFLAGSDGGLVDRVRRANAAIRSELPAGAYFIDLERVSGELGRNDMYDARSYFWTRQPFSEAGVVRLAEYAWAGLRAITRGPKKLLVLDLDNTLWGGVVGETGPLGVELGDTAAGAAFQDFQRVVRGLAQRGCLLAVCSKNNRDDALEPFEKNPDMVLGLDDFVAFEAGWEPKADVIRNMASSLGLGLDSFVFFDDEPAERELVRQALPEVEVIDVPADPAGYRRALLSGLWFESVQVSDEDRKRTEQYKVESKRAKSKGSAASVGEYLRSLELTGETGTIDEASFGRALQLIGKTNQFNLTTRRHSRDTVEAMLARPGTVALTLRMHDKFGDYGLVAVAIALAGKGAQRDELTIDTWLMSCRVIGRTAEQFLFNALLERAKDQGSKRLVGEYIATKKNAVIADLYTRLGFSPRPADDRGSRFFELAVADAVPASTYVSGVGQVACPAR